MNDEKRLLKIFLSPHISEKSSISSEKFNTVVIKVPMYVTKSDVKKVVQNLFKVQVSNINTLIIKSRKLRKNGRIGYSSSWKKAYITLKKGQNLNFIGHEE
ncbi:50S ribosomal protein L23 [Buchnera aphidicola (Schlechtendalia chinensis)]|uniref:Large ribosomal subunit protein uL23 n=1 Tax=Buchnera aphidicola subsp. Schlechtendalia chinensis TaxID=118110 RepID=A0A172WE25_BUCSC|nr:50S ribosomal protein L23 [Buchnera aphidicola]ANF17223.1 50S ribosomal protein L23 [Buchnera aphidicola (Schlechtendalia chinensis)]